MTQERGKKIAVIGAGVAGVVAAYLLSRRHEVQLFESNSYIGGHTNTVEIPSGPDAGLPVDTGFIVLNDQTYPLMHRFLADLKVPVRYSDMSFGYYCRESGLQYAGTGLKGLFAQPANIFSPSHVRFLLEIKRFCQLGMSTLENSVELAGSVAEFCKRHGLSSKFLRDYLIPMAGAIWSAPDSHIENFPIETLLRFFANHGLLNLKQRPRWQTVVGGSYQYVKAFCRQFPGKIHVNCPVQEIVRQSAKVKVGTAEGEQEFDYVIIALHADFALRVLRDPDDFERRLLGAWSYQNNHTVLHTDLSFLPPNPRAWASWNYCREAEQDRPTVSVTYDMTRLQGLRANKRYLVTLNPRRDINQAELIASFNYTHPVYTENAIFAQKELSKLQGKRNTFYCGSYFGFGFHEDAVKSAVAVSRQFGIEL